MLQRQQCSLRILSSRLKLLQYRWHRWPQFRRRVYRIFNRSQKKKHIYVTIVDNFNFKFILYYDKGLLMELVFQERPFGHQLLFKIETLTKQHWSHLKQFCQQRLQLFHLTLFRQYATPFWQKFPQQVWRFFIKIILSFWLRWHLFAFCVWDQLTQFILKL